MKVSETLSILTGDILSMEGSDFVLNAVGISVWELVEKGRGVHTVESPENSWLKN